VYCGYGNDGEQAFMGGEDEMGARCIAQKSDIAAI
jgi:hypothetical protein